MGLDQELRILHPIKENEIKYFRKCNFLRKYLIDNTVLEEDDNCKEVLVPTDIFKKLITYSKIVLKYKENDNAQQIAEKYLPTCGGFFFGSTEYDEYYYDDVKNLYEDLKEYENNDKILITYWDWW